MQDDSSSQTVFRNGLTRRHLMVAAAGLSALALVPTRTSASLSMPSSLPLEELDYAAARRRFRTHLLRKISAPEKSAPLGTPVDGTRVTYSGGPNGSIELVAWLSNYTPSKKLKPAVLFLHGGNATGDGHWALMKPYWEAGFVVLLPSFRGENGQKGNYSGFYDETSDALAAASYLEGLPGIDPDRVFLAGHSNGGTLSLLASMTRKFRAAVPISAGVNSWRYFNRYTDEVCFDDSNPQEFVMRSSVCFGPSLKCPTLLLRGTEERPFDADHKLLMERVQSAGMRIDNMLLPGNHNGVVPGAVVESIRFFNQFA
ncbi:alpha/beta hydrolase family protein [Agrobacterium rosae]|uniref:Alpha/beta fold hydrolase n=1 Tax=Agrobacterium rosae TaxID=1972867 RepID=A0AAE5RY27_9HYPH|nr:alpha/beta fold hydrolase [Agrobacterium rosae]KAA3514296.1 S9 family peptidase [Agrobacterium rosae]KAA3522961.1 S9 family peptidase [Agrobacterium rosae]MCM2433739.1 S9 family peptidase [Agrobacterium rosae]MDX8329703.1 alpha/beta fold hydrolase [Agrobacterium rosae]MQB47665.1 S9 family peptidase [Agrobacterium rosae]